MFKQYTTYTYSTYIHTYIHQNEPKILLSTYNFMYKISMMRFEGMREESWAAMLWKR